MKYSWVAASLLALSMGPAALAAPKPDLEVSYSPPVLTPVYAPGSYDVTVSNIGNRNANNVELTIELPATATSPSIFIMGNLWNDFSSNCALDGSPGTVGGTRLVCDLGRVRKNRSAEISFTIELPEKTGPLVFSATATTTTPGDPNPTNNTDVMHTAALDYYENTLDFVSGQVAYVKRHCTGMDLSAFFECAKFPSSISSFVAVFHDNGSISIPGQPDYTGSWTLSGDTLTFDYTFIPSGMVEVEFSGRGVPQAGCFEGLTRFPDGNGGYSDWVAPYEVCPQ